MQNYLRIEDIEEILSKIEYRDWTFTVHIDKGYGHLYLQLHFPSEDSYSGEPSIVNSRKWLLSNFMTKSEVVQTALKAVLTSVEHEARENFRYQNKAIFGPHFDVDALVEFSRYKDNLDMRTGEWVNRTLLGSGASGHSDSGPTPTTVPSSV